MKNSSVKAIYGKPERTDLPYCKEFYCAMCHKIPIIDTWDRSTGKIVGAEITRLWPVHMVSMTQEQIVMMICEGCVQRVEAKMKKEIINRRMKGEWPFDDNGGGGIPVR